MINWAVDREISEPGLADLEGEKSRLGLSTHGRGSCGCWETLERSFLPPVMRPHSGQIWGSEAKPSTQVRVYE